MCIDDKYQVKIGELDAPVASAERGRQVIARSGMLLQATEDTKSLMTFVSIMLPPYLHGVIL